MDDDHASVLLGAVLSEYERWPFDTLAGRVGHPETREVHTPNGARFTVEVTVDRFPAGGYRVAGGITDGRGGRLRRAFHRWEDGRVEYGK